MTDRTENTAAEPEAISGTYIYDGRMAQKGYAVNKMFMSLKDAENRAAFKQDEAGYAARYGLTEDQIAPIRDRDLVGILRQGGNIYYVWKIASILGWNMRQVCANQASMTLDDFMKDRYPHWRAEG